MIIDGVDLSNEDSTDTGGCGFGVPGVLSRTSSEAMEGSRILDVIDCEDSAGSAGLLETGLDNRSSVTIGISPEDSFGDDLSVSVNGVLGAGDMEGERAGCLGSNRREAGRSVTLVKTGVEGSAFNTGLLPDACPAGLGVPARLILNLEASFLAFRGGGSGNFWSAA